MRSLAWAFLAAGLACATAGAAIIVTYSTPATLETTVTPPPVVFQAGPGASKARYFSPPIEATANGTGVTGGVNGKAGVDVKVKDVLRIVDQTGSPRNVTLSGTQVTNARVEAFEWRVMNGTTLVATLDLKAATPSVTFTLPASTTYKVTMRLDLADGAGVHNTPTSFDLRLGVE